MYDLVISYSRSDVEWVGTFHNELKGRGLHIWADNKIEPGTDDWSRDIEEAISNTKFVVAVMSPASFSSQWVRKELAFADNKGVRIIPVLVEGEEAETIPLRLSNRDYVNARGSARGSSADKVNEIIVGRRDFRFDSKPTRSWIETLTATIKKTLKHPISVTATAAFLIALVFTAVFVDAELRAAIRKFNDAKGQYWAQAYDVMRENFFLKDVVDENGEPKPNTIAYNKFTDETNSALLNSMGILEVELKDRGFGHTKETLKTRCRPLKKELMDPLWEAAPENMKKQVSPTEADWQKFQLTPDFVRIRKDYFEYCDLVVHDAKQYRRLWW